MVVAKYMQVHGKLLTLTCFILYRHILIQSCTYMYYIRMLYMYVGVYVYTCIGWLFSYCSFHCYVHSSIVFYTHYHTIDRLFSCSTLITSLNTYTCTCTHKQDGLIITCNSWHCGNPQTTGMYCTCIHFHNLARFEVCTAFDLNIRSLCTMCINFDTPTNLKLTTLKKPMPL